MDWKKWCDDFINAGFDAPDLDTSELFDLIVVDQNSVQYFLEKMEKFEIEKEALKCELLQRINEANCWWEVSDLFPAVFVDFDQKKLGAFYFRGPKVDRYAPDEWQSEFVDFANIYPADVFPSAEKFWLIGDVDVLKILNERGRARQ